MGKWGAEQASGRRVLRGAERPGAAGGAPRHPASAPVPSWPSPAHRLMMNPGLSAETQVDLPSAAASPSEAAKVASLVCKPRTTSTSGMRGTGFLPAQAEPEV